MYEIEIELRENRGENAILKTTMSPSTKKGAETASLVRQLSFSAADGWFQLAANDVSFIIIILLSSSE